jgi:hypothetical protein
VVSDGAALGKEELAARAFVGHSYDRARDRVYHSLLLLRSISAAKPFTKDGARGIVANIAKLPNLLIMLR